MRYLLFCTAAHAEAAKAFAEPLRHRRHDVFLRDVGAFAQYPEAELCDALLLMHPADEPVPDHFRKAMSRYYLGRELQRIEPGAEPWPPTEDELAAMSPLNTLRHDAALLGIEIDPAYDETRLAGLIRAAKGEQSAEDEAEEERAAQIAQEVDAERARQEVAAKDAAAAGGAPPVDVDRIMADFLQLPADNVDMLRVFAKANNIPSPINPKTRVEKVWSGIRANIEKMRE